MKYTLILSTILILAGCGNGHEKMPKRQEPIARIDTSVWYKDSIHDVVTISGARDSEIKNVYFVFDSTAHTWYIDDSNAILHKKIDSLQRIVDSLIIGDNYEMVSPPRYAIHHYFKNGKKHNDTIHVWDSSLFMSN
jgi:hypothetical protein